MKKGLSKSLYLRGLQCHKSLWLYKNDPDMRTPPDEAKQAIFDMGTNVGILAQQLFPGGTVIEFDRSAFEQKVRQTQDLISAGVDTIYEATFAHNEVIVMVDILHKGKKGWDLYEVKASTDKEKIVYRNDIALQHYVVTESGLPLSSAALVLLNKEYIRQGELDIPNLFAIEDFTETAVDQRDDVIDNLGKMHTVLEGPCPDIDIGPHCSDPYECDLMEHCWKHIPEYSVFDISGLRSVKKFALYNSRIIKVTDVPRDFDMSDNQRLQVDAEINDTVIIDKEAIRSFLDELCYPRYYLDFETFMPAVPVFDGTMPYQQNVSQFSLHVQRTKGSDLEHHEYLMEAGSDDREELVEKLTGLIPEDACVIVYNKTFERSRIKEMAELFPGYKTKLLNINENMIDLMVPFQKKFYYTKELNGSYSIKYVLPALVPDLSYEGMVIGDGGAAMRAYEALPFIDDKEKVEQIKKDLLEYCKLDTLGMVKIVEKLEGMC